MPSVSAVTLAKMIISIVPAFCPEDVHTVKVENKGQTGADLVDMVDHCHKMCLPVCDDSSNKELLLCVVDQFLEATHDHCLHLNHSSDCCTKFCSILGGNLCVVSQGISDAQAAKMVDNFMLNVDTLIAWCLQPTACFDQIECDKMHTKTRARTMEEHNEWTT